MFHVAFGNNSLVRKKPVSLIEAFETSTCNADGADLRGFSSENPRKSAPSALSALHQTGKIKVFLAGHVLNLGLKSL